MWLTIALLAYLINAGVYVADKFLLSKKIHSSIVYAFYVGIWSFLNIFLLFIDPWVPNFQELIIDLLAGILFLATLIFWYKALHQSEATRVVPIVGALTPIFSFLLSFAFLGEHLSERHLLAFAVLIIGGVLISVKHTKFYEFKMMADRFKNVFGDLFGHIHAGFRPTQRLLINSTISAFFFAAFYVLAKYIYSHQPFVGGFVWSRMGSFIGVVLILLVPAWRRLISEHNSNKTKTVKMNWFFFLTVRASAAIAFIFLNRAISLGNVALINSLQGAQYLFLILLVLFISKKHPHIFKEEVGGGVAFQKVCGALLVGLGLYMLV
jgi:drug/metabolite transporter (DMT)-like permease